MVRASARSIAGTRERGPARPTYTTEHAYDGVRQVRRRGGQRK
ncbi:hypothetical protein STRTUCAR8_08100 [Streptomyces turgidiscabies Car8]|uniref:Uncharacterized protein n=1 Tax=Streptomyces turgidiscabies (strain Car8) TaxID=698760 RepID=L7F0K5_STRT8|nr:hypothetical protein STRTUCAR8_08100 [Streptomyces turgidiscabies Car8]